MINTGTRQLKNCPFCGSKAQLDDCRTIWRVICTNEKCEGMMLGERAPEPENDEDAEQIDWDYYRNTAIDRWNKRV